MKSESESMSFSHSRALKSASLSSTELPPLGPHSFEVWESQAGVLRKVLIHWVSQVLQVLTYFIQY